MPQNVRWTDWSTVPHEVPEHYRDYKFANNKSKFAQHIIEEGHAFGPMSDIMEVAHTASKGKMLDTLQRFYIYKETKLGTQINDKLTA